MNLVIDTSALMGIFLREPDHILLMQKIESYPHRMLCTGNYVELGLVIDARRDAFLTQHMDAFLEEFRIQLSPVTPSLARRARAAGQVYGRGSGHPARLNFGDCFSYALASIENAPLLFKGDDFKHTDVRVA